MIERTNLENIDTIPPICMFRILPDIEFFLLLFRARQEKQVTERIFFFEHILD